MIEDTDKMIQALEKTLRLQLPKLYEIDYEFNLKVLKYSENITFLLNEPSIKRKRVFRVNRPDYHDIQELNGEIMWMNEIKEETDLLLPEVYTGINGGFIQHFSHNGISYTGILISFLEGKMVEELSGNELNQQMVEIGKILAKLHIQSQNRNQHNEIKRFSWGIEDMLGADAKWGNWRDYRKLTREQNELLEKVEEEIIKRLKNYGMESDKYGLIHADMHCSNIIVSGGISQIFDFDDCGYGWYLYDFGCSLVEYADTKDLLGYMIEGYETLRKLTEEDRHEVELFVLLRKMVRLAWIAGHSDSDTAKGIRDDYFSETFKMAEVFLDCQTIKNN